MKFTRDRYQHGSLRRVQRAKGPDVWEFRYSTYENCVRKQRQLTLSSKKYPSEAAVKRKVEGLLLKLNSGTSSTTLQEPTLEAVMEIFTREEMPERVKSQQNYRLLMDRHIQPKWGSLSLSRIRPFEVEAWLKELNYSPETKRHIKSMLYRLFECGMKRGWLEAQRNPMSLVRVKGRSRVVEKVVLTPDQMAIVRGNLEDPILLMSELACYLGLRICEVLGLMWEDFDPVAKTLSICRSAVDGYVADVKTEASRDVIPLSGEFISFILRWQQIAPLSAEGWMFPSIITGRPYHAGILLRRHLAPLASKVGVPRLGWHTFRHTFRSWLDAVGTAVGVQQKMMRHADVATTMNIYGKGMMDSKLDAHTKLLVYAGVGICGVEVDQEST
ncbi:MAG: tyrosine-type recombinase/integrase [Acidobacteriota bacterium]